MSAFEELERRNVLRVGAAYLAGGWLLVQIVNEVFPLFGFPSAGRLVVILLAIGLVPTLVIAWAFRWTRDGIERELAASSAPVPTRGFDRAIMLVLALGIALFAVDRFVLDPARDARIAADAAQRALEDAAAASVPDKSIAVLAFADLSAAGDQEYFADGIAEELLNVLAKVPELRVAGRTSAFSFKGKDLPIPEIAAQLNVAHVLEGSVRTSGNTVRITAQLIEARTDSHLWSETYDREMGDVFAIQDDIAAHVGEALRAALLGDAPTVAATTPEVYAAYLQARHINTMQRVDDLPRARELIEQVIERDPGYLPARRVLFGILQSFVNFGLLSPREGEAQLRRAVSAAAAIWPNAPEIDAARAWLALAYDRDLETAARYVQSALARDPAELGVLGLAQSLAIELNRHDDAIAIGEYVVARDPICGYCYGALMRGYYVSRRYDAVIETYATARALGFDQNELRLQYANALEQRGDVEAALKEVAALDPSFLPEPVKLFFEAVALWKLERRAEFDTAFARLRERTEPIVPMLVADVHNIIGDVDTAIDLFLALPPETYVTMAFFDGRRGDALREHPRWPELAAKAGIWPDPRERIVFEVNLPP